jgi:DNA-binding MurR/RpiR family transcriptional regulator
MSGEGPILDYDGLVAALVRRRGGLSRRNAQLAQFVLNHPEDVAINSIVRLATLASVTPAAITRFAQELGFAGFPALQRVFRERLLGPRPSYSDRLSDLIAQAPAELAEGDLMAPGAMLDGFVQAAVNSLLLVRESVDRAVLEGAVATLAAAEAVHVAGARGAFGVAAYARYGLARTGIRAHLIDNIGAMRAEQVASMGPRDALIVLTFDDYTPETIEIARAAFEAGRPVVAITDNELSPVAAFSRHSLFVREARLGHFRSQVPALVVCQAIIVSLGSRLAQASGEGEN